MKKIITFFAGIVFCLSLVLFGTLLCGGVNFAYAENESFEIENYDSENIIIHFYDSEGSSLHTYSGPVSSVAYGGAAITFPASTKSYEYNSYVWTQDRNATDDTNDVDLNDIGDSFPEGIPESINLYVRYVPTPVEYTITYDLNGGTAWAIPTESVNINSGTVTITNRIVKTGYEFVGWTGEGITTPTKNLQITISSEDDLYERSYTANYQEVVVEYDLTFQIHDEHETFGTINETSLRVQKDTAISISGNKITVGTGADAVEVIATPNQTTTQYIYSFITWQSENSVLSGKVTGDNTFTAFFHRDDVEYRVTYSDKVSVKLSDSGEVVNYGETLKYGTVVEVEFETTPHYHVDSFKINGVEAVGVVGNKVTIEITETTDITYTESIDKFIVTFGQNNANLGSVSETSLEIPYGTNVAVVDDCIRFSNGDEVVATPKTDDAKFVYSFVSWSEGVDVITSNTSYIASFSSVIKRYSVTFDNDFIKVKVKGSGVLIQSGDKVPYDETIIVTYTSTAHYHMSVFTVNGEDKSSNNVEVLVNGDMTIVFEEELDTYSITFGDGVKVESGGIELSSGDVVEYLTIIKVSYTLSKNYKVSTFTSNGQNISQNEEIEVGENIVIVFVEEKDNIKINISNTITHGKITTSKGQIFGGTVTLKSTPDEYYKLVRVYYVTSETSETIEINNLTFTMPNEEVEIFAEFEKEYYVLKNDETGLEFAVKMSDVSDEPTLTVSVEENLLDAMKKEFNSENVKVYRFSLKIGGTEISDFNKNVKIKIKVPESFNAGKCQVVEVLENGKTNVLKFLYDTNSKCFTGSVSGFKTLAFGEKVLVTGDIENTAEGGEESGFPVVIIIAIVAGVVLIAGLVVTLVIVKNKKKKRKV